MGSSPVGSGVRIKAQMRDLPKRLKRVEEELRFRAWVRYTRVLESAALEELERMRQGWLPNDEPEPGGSRLDYMTRSELLKLWRESDQYWLGHNDSQMDYFLEHGHWPNQACNPECNAQPV